MIEVFKTFGNMSEIFSRGPKVGDFVKFDREPLRIVTAVSASPQKAEWGQCFIVLAEEACNDGVVEFSTACERSLYANPELGLDWNQARIACSWNNKNIFRIEMVSQA